MIEIVATFLRVDGYLFGALLTLPFGLWLTIAFIMRRFLWTDDLHRNVGSIDLLMLLVLPVVAGTHYLILRSYKRRDSLPHSVFPNAFLPVIIVMLLIGIMAASALDAGEQPRISALGVFFGLVLLIFGQHFILHVVFGITFLLVSVLVPIVFSFSVHLYVGLLFSALWVISCIYEHVVFVKRRNIKAAPT